ncbi:MAG: hypothetical protein ACRDN0_20315 [Trebonia sp.]
MPAESAARAALRGRLETVQGVLAWSRSERWRRPTSSRMEVYTEVVSSSTREALRKLGGQFGS